MSRGQGYQEVEGELSLGDLPAHLGKDDSRADVRMCWGARLVHQTLLMLVWIKAL
jgi:hypothetical protein